jgi:hypothetical protein
LLSVRRTNVRELAGLLGLPWQEDPANLDPAHRRNRVRACLIPHLESEWNPQLSRRLAALAHTAAAEAVAVGDEVIHPVEQDGGLLLPAPALWAAGSRLAGHSIRAALRRLLPPHPPTSQELAAIMEVLSGVRRSTSLRGGIEVERRGPWLVVGPGAKPPLAGEAASWEVPGALAWRGFQLEAIVMDKRPTAFPLSPWRAVLDADRIGDLAVRSPVDSDRIPVPGGSQSLSEAIKSSGVDGQAATRWPVVESAGVVVWVPGVRTLPTGWIDSSTRRYLWVAAEEVAWPR